MRSLTSGQSCTASPNSITPGTLPSLSNTTANTPKTITVPESTPDPCTSTPIAAHTVYEPSPLFVQDLQLENSTLKEQISQLKQQWKTVLDHSIEFDNRLMEYTNELFVVKTQQDMSKPCNNLLASTTMVDVAVQCEVQNDCSVKQCVENKELIQRLKTTVEVLEADLQCLRAEVMNCNCSPKRDIVDSEGWNICLAKNHQRPVTTKNRFEAITPVNLVSPSSEAVSQGNNNRRKKKLHTTKTFQTMHKLKSHTHLKNPSYTTHQQKNNKISLSFSKINIESDSHGRMLAGIIKDLVEESTKVSGVVKPGAGLLDVTSDLPPPPDTCTVLIAGTNDVAARQPAIIYQHLEQRVAAKLNTSKMVICTLPHRHDLPAHHPVNTQTELVNRHIRELVNKYDGIELIEFNRINRRLFTSHGMHLRVAGKRLLARLVLDGVVKVDEAPRHAAAAKPRHRYALPMSTAETTTDAESIPSPKEAVCLPYESYADAVKTVPPSERHIAVDASLASHENLNFLEIANGKQRHQCQP